MSDQPDLKARVELERHLRELPPFEDAELSPGLVLALLSRITDLEAERDEADDRYHDMLERATYEVGGAPRFWDDRAQAAETRLALAEKVVVEAGMAKWRFECLAKQFRRQPDLVSLAPSLDEAAADLSAALTAYQTPLPHPSRRRR